ncbi:MAG: Asp-tRNA(Asn)/Glu-tRNA(Gln) amidotransferase subunit GatA [Actinomycetota bacterium]|nr:Asp-tRNA(Asn)/Glu-tRNA(Gln) amidotransferase subunit GatA [Actinomycetota bacterium]MDI6822676.1 Asp-tRNA(Asn)/Glu-tRNA(Gln) amidotransferase subunit GatA [Actinomycetota bacterium]
MELYKLTAHELHKMLKERKISAVELCRSVFSRIGQVEDKIRAYITLTEERALAKAREVDEKIKAGKQLSPLAGIPTAIKDNMCTKGLLTTCASKILQNYIPIYTARAVERLFAQDIVLTGKTNMDEFAMGSSTENSAFFVTRNPWNLETVPGGSSGGSAAAVAAGEAILSLGSDTGGSIRQPAALCGVVGFKPTYGLVSRYGLVAFASSLDQIGPITKDVTDCALLLNYIAGHDPLDSTSLRVKIPDYMKALVNEVKGLKIGVPVELMGEGIQTEVREAIENAIKLLEDLGALCQEVSLPHLDYALSAYYIIAPAEASSNLARFDGVRYGYRTPQKVEDIMEMYFRTRAEGFGSEVKRRIMLGTYALSAGYYEAYYGQAQKVRTLIVNDFNKAFEKFDVLISPTSPTVAFKIGEKYEDPLRMYMSDICTIPVNLAGIPAISIPCGQADGLPVGLQIMGKPLDEETILRVAYTFERNFGYEEKPNL